MRLWLILCVLTDHGHEKLKRVRGRSSRELLQPRAQTIGTALGADYDQIFPISLTKMCRTYPTDSDPDSDLIAPVGALIAVNCLEWDVSMYLAFNQMLRWMAGGVTAALVHDWRQNHDFVLVRLQAAEDEWHECSGFLTRFPVKYVSMPESHLLHIGDKNAWLGIRFTNPKYELPFCVMWCHTDRGTGVKHDMNNPLIRSKSPGLDKARVKKDYLANDLTQPLGRFDCAVTDAAHMCSLNHFPEALLMKLQDYPKHFQRFEMLILQYVPNYDFTNVKVFFLTNWRMLYEMKTEPNFHHFVIRNTWYLEASDFHALMFSLDSILEEIGTNDTTEFSAAQHLHLNIAVSGPT